MTACRKTLERRSKLLFHSCEHSRLFPELLPVVTVQKHELWRPHHASTSLTRGRRRPAFLRLEPQREVGPRKRGDTMADGYVAGEGKDHQTDPGLSHPEWLSVGQGFHPRGGFFGSYLDKHRHSLLNVFWT